MLKPFQEKTLPCIQFLINMERKHGPDHILALTKNLGHRPSEKVLSSPILDSDPTTGQRPPSALNNLTLQWRTSREDPQPPLKVDLLLHLHYVTERLGFPRKTCTAIWLELSIEINSTPQSLSTRCLWEHQCIFYPEKSLYTTENEREWQRIVSCVMINPIKFLLLYAVSFNNPLNDL